MILVAKKAVRVRVSGLVQGVAFRASLAEVARSRGVAGWVRNRFDGSVEAQLEGEGDSVDKVVAWAKKGPPRARVDSVKVIGTRPGNLKGFHISG